MAASKPILISFLKQGDEDRLLDRVVRIPRGCWEWRGARNGQGYGNMVLRGRWLKPHRLSYVLFRGPIPDGLEVCHDCPGGDNPLCCNPAHLFLGTHSDNMRDAAEKGTCRPPYCRGVQKATSRLDEDAVRRIRSVTAAARASGEKGWRLRLAGECGISPQGIYRVVSGKLWGHVQ